MNTDEKFMKLAIEEAKKSFAGGEKTPFGAVIAKGNKVIGVAHNTAKKSFDPTAHAEINAIRKASKKMRNHHLDDCVLYTTCEPCPMCFAAVWWARISKIVYGVNLSDIVSIGRREININCRYLNKKSGNRIKIKSGVLRKEGLKLFE